MAAWKRWTLDEIEYLEEHYGLLQTERIAIDLGRTFHSVKNKANKLGLGAVGDQTELIHLPQFVEVSKINRSTLTRWYKIYSFPMKKKRFEKRVCFMIDPTDFWKWAEANKNMIEWDKFEKHAIGAEPKWVEEARRGAVKRKHLTKGSMKKIPWTPGEDNTLRMMIKQNKYTYPELTETLGRTQGAIKRRLQDLNIRERPVSLSNHNPYTVEEIELILEMYRKGHGFDVIAKELNRSEAGVRGKVERLGYTFRNRVMERQEG